MLTHMKGIGWLGLALLIYAFTVFSPHDYGLDRIELKDEFLDGKFPRLPSVSWKLTKVFPELSVSSSVTNLVKIPGTDKLMLLGQEGLVWILENDDTRGETKLVLDISKQVVTTSDAGLLGVAFHPEFNDANSNHWREIYFFYTYRFKGDEPLFNRLSRFKFSENLNTILPSSEEILIQQYDRNGLHNGGDMFFDNDGYLYVSLGDEGGSNNFYGNAQKINASLFSGVIRIDVDLDSTRSHPIRRYPLSPEDSPEGFPDNINQHYMIPNDNPWVSETGDNLEEFFAIGLRSPHRMYYDTLTENIWVADVGQSAKEEISLLTKGSNAQWPYQEGSRVFSQRKPDSIIGIETPPIFDYGRDQGLCIIGGLVYRGDKYADLKGQYIFGDYVSNNIWALDPQQNNKVTFLCKVSNLKPVSFLSSPEGFIYVLTLDGNIFKLTTEVVLQEIPNLLSQTGAFTDVKNLEPAPGIIPYDVNSPLWSDGASKKRWISVPHASGGIAFTSDSTWDFPIGTVFIKHFELPVSNDSVVRLETRFFIIDENKKGYGITYKWNREGTNAELIANGELVNEEILLTHGGVSTTQTWSFPSRTQCLDCHNSNAGYVLGVKTAQPNKPFVYRETGITDNQLRTWDHLGLFSESLAEIDVEMLPRLASVKDTTASLQFRVRSYLDANCSYCHMPEGVDAAFDARSSTPLLLQRLINQDIVSRNSATGNKVIKPHSLDSSELWLRDKSLGEDKMPPLGKNTLDEAYLNVLKNWIISLQSYSIEEEAVVCYDESYTFPDGKTLANIKVPTTYVSKFTSSQGLDSIINTSVQVNKHCQETVVDAYICFGNSYIFGSDSLTEAGEYTKVFTSSDDFDSTVVLNLEVQLIDSTLSVLDTALMINQDGATYQWIDYDAGNLEIEGENHQTFIPSRSGNYRARITADGCSILSEIKSFRINTITGLEQHEFEKDINIYPNPNEGDFTISFDDHRFSGTIEVSDLVGRTVFRKTVFNETELNVQFDAESGPYLLKFNKNHKTAIIKIFRR